MGAREFCQDFSTDDLSLQAGNQFPEHASGLGNTLRYAPSSAICQDPFREIGTFLLAEGIRGGELRIAAGAASRREGVMAGMPGSPGAGGGGGEKAGSARNLDLPFAQPPRFYDGRSRDRCSARRACWTGTQCLLDRCSVLAGQVLSACWTSARMSSSVVPCGTLTQAH
jgi:hypothetical protein